MTEADTAQNRTRVYLLVAVVVLVSLGVLSEYLLDSLDGYNPTDSDIKHDWIVASALMSGVSPYADLDELTTQFAPNSYRPPPTPSSSPPPKRSPRMPGAIALGVPLLLIPVDALPRLSGLASMAVLVVPLYLVARTIRRPFVMFAATAILLTGPMFWQVRFANMSILLTVLIAASLVRLVKGDSVLAGFALGVCITLKAYPLLLIALLAAYGFRKALLTTVTTLLALNASLLLLPHVAMTDTLDAVLGAYGRFGSYPSNVSMIHLINQRLSLTAGVAFFSLTSVAAAAWIVKKPSRLEIDGLFLLSTAILISPLSWMHYIVGAFPLMLWVVLDHRTKPVSRTVMLAGFSLCVALLDIWFSAVGLALICGASAYERMSLTAQGPAASDRRETVGST